MTPTETFGAQALTRPGFTRTYPDRPALGVSIAVFRAGRVPCRRARPPFKGVFSLPRRPRRGRRDIGECGIARIAGGSRCRRADRRL